MVFSSPSKIAGVGLYASSDFVRGFVIGIIQGPLTSFPTDYAIEPKSGLYIETDNPWRLINHSCNPNLELIGERVLVTTRHVHEGEELYLDYSTFIYDDWTMNCACNSAKCRGTIKKCQ